MPCTFQHPLQTLSAAQTGDLTAADLFVRDDSRVLIVSDSPETLTLATAPDPSSLYQCAHQIPVSGTLSIRVFLYHLNGQGGYANGFNLWIGVTLLGGSGSIQNHRSHSIAGSSSDPIGTVGICLARAHAFGLLNIDGDFNLPLPGVEQAFLAGSAGAHGSSTELVGSVHEFDVVGPPASGATIRTMVSSGAGLPPQSQMPIPKAGNTRGWWPSSSITAIVSAVKDVGPVVHPDENTYFVQERSMFQPGSAEVTAYAWPRDRFG